MSRRFYINSEDIFLPKDAYTKLTLVSNRIAEDMIIADDQANTRGSLLSIVKAEMDGTEDLATLGEYSGDAVRLEIETIFYSNSQNDFDIGTEYLKIQPDDNKSFYLGNVLSSILTTTDLYYENVEDIEDPTLKYAVEYVLNQIYKDWSLSDLTSGEYSAPTVGHFTTNGKLILLENKKFQATYNNRIDVLNIYNDLFDPDFSSSNTRATLDTRLTTWHKNGDNYYADFDSTMTSPFLTVLGELDSSVQAFFISRCFPIILERVDLNDTFHIYKFPEALATESVINSLEQRIYLRGLKEEPTFNRDIYLGKNQMGTVDIKEYNDKAKMMGNTNIINFYKRNLEYTVNDTETRYVYNWSSNEEETPSST